MSYFRILTICVLLVYFASAAGCHCFDYYLHDFRYVHDLFCSLVLKHESRAQNLFGDSNVHWLGQKFITWVKKNRTHYIGQPKQWMFITWARLVIWDRKWVRTEWCHSCGFIFKIVPKRGRRTFVTWRWHALLFFARQLRHRLIVGDQSQSEHSSQNLSKVQRWAKKEAKSRHDLTADLGCTLVSRINL